MRRHPNLCQCGRADCPLWQNDDHPDDEELQRGYDKARDMFGDDYADYLIDADNEHRAKGLTLTPWPLSLIGNDGD